MPLFHSGSRVLDGLTVFSDLARILLVKVPVDLLGFVVYVQGGSNMTGTDLCVNKPHCAAAVRP